MEFAKYKELLEHGGVYIAQYLEVAQDLDIFAAVQCKSFVCCCYAMFVAN